jgi:hypothetical protein
VLSMLKKQGFVVDGVPDANGAAADDPFSGDESSSSDGESGSESEQDNNMDGVVDPADLEGVVRRRRKELQDRLAKVIEGRAGAHQVETRKTGGKSNLEKRKTKNFTMVKHKVSVKQKDRASLRQQQMQLKKHMKKMLKASKTVQKIRRRSRKTRA